mmetsp:Transcript_2892/g.8838  ORF Transcript_2892/g.8838 Transcript_2892/m.8838 type:complete len:287 (+) Transcript_2892:1983-2843(+)
MREAMKGANSSSASRRIALSLSSLIRSSRSSGSEMPVSRRNFAAISKACFRRSSPSSSSCLLTARQKSSEYIMGRSFASKKRFQYLPVGGWRRMLRTNSGLAWRSHITFVKASYSCHKSAGTSSTVADVASSPAQGSEGSAPLPTLSTTTDWQENTIPPCSSSASSSTVASKRVGTSWTIASTIASSCDSVAEVSSEPVADCAAVKSYWTPMQNRPTPFESEMMRKVTACSNAAPLRLKFRTRTLHPEPLRIAWTSGLMVSAGVSAPCKKRQFRPSTSVLSYPTER